MYTWLREYDITLKVCQKLTFQVCVPKSELHQVVWHYTILKFLMSQVQNHIQHQNLRIVYFTMEDCSMYIWKPWLWYLAFVLFYLDVFFFRNQERCLGSIQKMIYRHVTASATRRHNRVQKWKVTFSLEKKHPFYDAIANSFSHCYFLQVLITTI